MNVTHRLSNLSRRCGAWGLRLTIALPLLLVPLMLTVRPLGAESSSMPHDHGSTDHHDAHDSGMPDMHDGDMHDMHDGDMHDMHNDADMHDMHDEEMSSDHGDHHSHGAIEVDAALPIPQVTINVTPDSASGWNLEIITTDFELNGATTGETNSPNQGHAHLYANGVKIARVYGRWYHIPTLPSGEVELEVVLNSNQHQTLMYDGEPIAALIAITTN